MVLNAQWDLGQEASRDIAATLNVLLADAFVLLLKTMGCRWHVSGPHFQAHRLLFRQLEEQIGTEINGIAERIRRIGPAALNTIGDVSRLRRLAGNDVASLSPLEMIAELVNDNLQLEAYLREAHGLCEGYGDVATANCLERLIDNAEGRVRDLFAASRPTQATKTAGP